MTHDEEIIKEATEIYEKNQNAGALVGDLLRIIKSQKAHIEKLEKVEHFATKTIEKQTAEIEKKDTEIDILIRKKEALRDEISELTAEVERLQKLQKPTKTSGFIIQNGKVVFYSNMLNGYRHEYKDLDEVVKELNLMLQSCYKCDEVVSHYKGNLKIAKSEAYREFWMKLRTHGHKMMGSDWSGEFCAKAILVEDGDNLLKELTESK